MLIPALLTNPTSDLLILLVIVLLFVGPKRLPGLGRSLGSGIREFKDGITGGSDSSGDETSEIPSSKSKSDSGSAA